MLTEQRSPLLGDFQAAGFPFSIQAPRTLWPGASGALLVLGGLLGVVSLVLGGIGGIGSLLLHQAVHKVQRHVPVAYA